MAALKGRAAACCHGGADGLIVQTGMMAQTFKQSCLEGIHGVAPGNYLELITVKLAHVEHKQLGHCRPLVTLQQQVKDTASEARRCD